MGRLPPAGWGDVATRRDIERLDVEIDAMFGKMIAANIAAMIGLAGLAIAAVSLT